MTSIFWVMGIASLGWLWVLHALDRSAVPVWKAKYAYRLMSTLLFLALAFMASKALQWHTELVYMNRLCQ